MKSKAIKKNSFYRSCLAISNDEWIVVIFRVLGTILCSLTFYNLYLPKEVTNFYEGIGVVITFFMFPILFQFLPFLFLFLVGGFFLVIFRFFKGLYKIYKLGKGG